MKKTLLIALFALLAMAMVACGGGGEEASSGGGESAGGPTTLDIKGEDIAFDVTELTASAGNPITVNFENVGTLEHNWILVPPGVDPLEATEDDAIAGTNAGMLAGGESVTFTFDAPPAGTYDYVCTVEGHAAAGMVGKLTIE